MVQDICTLYFESILDPSSDLLQNYDQLDNKIYRKTSQLFVRKQLQGVTLWFSCIKESKVPKI